jgi:hypothetical protein
VTAWVAVSYGGGGVGSSGTANADGAVIVSAAITPRAAADQAVVRLSILTISTSRCTAVLRSSRNDRMLWAAARERPIRCFTLSSRFITPAPDLTARSGVASALHETTTSANGNLSSGPQVIEIQPSDKAFLTKGCRCWQKTP